AYGKNLSLARRRLICRMQRPEKRDQRRRLCRTEVLPVRGHVAAALNHLSNQLILREAHGHTIETGTTLGAGVAERVAIAALLGLKHQRALSLQRRRAAEQVLRHRVAAPRVHMRAPRRVTGEMREG